MLDSDLDTDLSSNDCSSSESLPPVFPVVKLRRPAHASKALGLLAVLAALVLAAIWGFVRGAPPLLIAVVGLVGASYGFIYFGIQKGYELLHAPKARIVLGTLVLFLLGLALLAPL